MNEIELLSFLYSARFKMLPLKVLYYFFIFYKALLLSLTEYLYIQKGVDYTCPKSCFGVLVFFYMIPIKLYPIFVMAGIMILHETLMFHNFCF